MAASVSNLTGVGLVNTATNPGTIQLPLVSSSPNRQLIFKDTYGNLSNNPLQFQTQGGDTFEDGTTTKKLQNSFGSLTFYGYSSKWYILGGTTQFQASISSLTVSSLNGLLPGNVTTQELISTTQGFLLRESLSTGQGVFSSVIINMLPQDAPYWDPKTFPALGFDPEPSPLALDVFGSARILKNLYIGSTTTVIGTAGIAAPQVSSANILTSSLYMYDPGTNLNYPLRVANNGLIFNGSNLLTNPIGVNPQLLSTPSLLSTTAGITYNYQTAGYLSTLSLISTTRGLQDNLVSTAGGIVEVPELISTTAGITVGYATADFISSLNLLSTTGGLQRQIATSDFISSLNLLSTTGGLQRQIATSDLISSLNLLSTTRGLQDSLVSTTGGLVEVPELISTTGGITTGYLTAGYLSTLSLISTTRGLQDSLVSTTGGLVEVPELVSTMVGLSNIAVTQIVAGTNITISPVGGRGAVTINAGGGSGSVPFVSAFTVSTGSLLASTINSFILSSIFTMASSIGVGTSTPQALLEVTGMSSIIRISDYTGSRNPGLELVRGNRVFGSDTFTDWKIHNESGNLIFYRKDTFTPSDGNAMVLTDLGRLGISCNSPTTLLDVNGIAEALTFSSFQMNTSSFLATNATISSLQINRLTIGTGTGWVNLGPLQTVAISSIQANTDSSYAKNTYLGNLSTATNLQFYGLYGTYDQTVLAEISTGGGGQELLVFKGSSTSDRIRFQTTGNIRFEPGVSARSFTSNTLATLSNAIPAMIITANSNVGISCNAPTANYILDVNGASQISTLVFPPTIGRKISLYAGNVGSNFAGQYYGIEIQSGEFRSVTEGTAANRFTWGQNPGNTFAQWAILSNANFSTSQINVSSIGIGTNLPSTPLDVAGQGSISSLFFRTGNPISVGRRQFLQQTPFQTGGATCIGVLSDNYDGIVGPFDTDWLKLRGLRLGQWNISSFAKFERWGSNGFVLGSQTAGNTTSADYILASNAFMQIQNVGTFSSLQTVASSITSSNATISTLQVNNITIGTGTGWVNIGPLQTVAISSIQANTNASFAITMSSFQANFSSIGVGCNAPTSQLDVHGTIEGLTVSSFLMNTSSIIAPNSVLSSLVTSSITFGTSPGWVRMNTVQAIVFSSIQTNTALGYVSSMLVGTPSTNSFQIPAFNLQLVQNSAAKPGAGGLWTIGSDLRIKENIADANLDRCYDDIRAVKLRRFAWSEKYFKETMGTDRHVLGFIAQEVSTIVPKAVEIKNAFGYPDFQFLNNDQLLMSLYGAVKRVMVDKEVLESTVKGQHFQIETLNGIQTTILSTLNGLQGR